MDTDTQSIDIHQATEVCFFAERGYRWKGEHPWILTIPVSELAYRCVESWLNIADSRYAEGMLPTEGLQTRYRRLTDSDAEQAEWDSFCDDLRDEAADMDMEYLAAWFIDINPSLFRMCCGNATASGISTRNANVHTDCLTGGLGRVFAVLVLSFSKVGNLACLSV